MLPSCSAANRLKIGYLIRDLCVEVGILDWAVALQQLVKLMNELANQVGKKLSAMIKSQLLLGSLSLPNYINAYLPISCCES